MKKVSIRLKPTQSSLKSFKEVFDDHEHLSRFIFAHNGIDESMEELGKMIDQGRTGATEPPAVWLRNMVTALHDEVDELSASIPRKWWRKEKLDVQNIRVELVDIFHFLISAAQVAGLSGNEFLKLYYKKRKINYDRQIHGFKPDDNLAVVI